MHGLGSFQVFFGLPVKQQKGAIAMGRFADVYFASYRR
jgi:hypothetical protein